MTLTHRLALVIAAALTATACGGGSSPTSPSPTTTATTPAPTTPAPAPAPAPTPAPVNLTGTWDDGTQGFNMTQSGSSLTGTQTQYRLDALNAVFSGTVSGTVSGNNVTLTFQNVITVSAFGDSLTCRGADSYDAQVTGNTLTGMYLPAATSYICDGGIPLPLPPLVTGRRIYTRR